MKIEEFIEKIRQCKPASIYTGYLGVKVKSNKEKTAKVLYMKTKCQGCGKTNVKSIHVLFNEPQNLTIFQADLLFMVYSMGKSPRDYANYHKCIAGKRFIENIKEIGSECHHFKQVSITVPTYECEAKFQ